MPKTIKIKFQNGIDKVIAVNEIFNELTGDYIFEETADPDFIFFGPYGNDIPPPGNYVRVGYFCENIKPDLSICEWAFGIPYEDEIDDYRYKKIQWHNLNPASLIKPNDYNPAGILEQKKGFCNFLYSHKVPYREAFFKELSKYKKVDAPGKSMNNMKSIDELYQGDVWQRKKQFLRDYKFTISFENDIYPGYQTEKLYDAMAANSVPIYCGDPLIGRVFNTESFIAGNGNTGSFFNWLEKTSQADFVDIRPQFYHNPYHRLKRKIKILGREVKVNAQFSASDLKKAVDKIVELDQDDDKYLQMLGQPWFNGNTPPTGLSLKSRWAEIFG